MKGSDARRLRETLGLSQTRFAATLSEGLGRTIGRETYRSWESRDKELPADVTAFLAALDDDRAAASTAGFAATAAPADTPDDGVPADEPPTGGSRERKPEGGLVVAGSTGAYAKMCAEAWELIGTGVAMVGAAVGNDTLRRDGEIIVGDKEQLGAAWGRLAETNEVLRRILQASDKQGAYLAVGLATGQTIAKVWDNHQRSRLVVARSAEDVLREAREHHDDGGVPV